MVYKTGQQQKKLVQAYKHHFYTNLMVAADTLI